MVAKLELQSKDLKEEEEKEKTRSSATGQAAVKRPYERQGRMGSLRKKKNQGGEGKKRY